MSLFVQLLLAALGGGVAVKLLDIGYRELLRRVDRRRSSRRFVDENLDPVLKAADELFGKLRSLAASDFRIRHAHAPSVTKLDAVGLLYLLASFWASIEVFRQKGRSVSIVRDDRGQKLSHFLDSLESRKVRIVDRLSQRAIAELVLEARDTSQEMVSFVKFVRLLNNDEEVQRWTTQVVHFLQRMGHTSERQRLLTYGIVIHAMIDTLDPNHQVSRERVSYPTKLSKRSWRDLKYRVFGQYLTFVCDQQKYLGPPKRRP